MPTLVNLMPSGTYLMEDFCYAGGLPAVMAELLGGGLLHGEPVTVTGRTVAENTDGAERVDSDVITPSTPPSSRPAPASPSCAATCAPTGP